MPASPTTLVNAQTHDARALAFGDASRLIKLVIGEALAVVHHLPGRGSQRDEMALDALAGRRRDSAGDAGQVERWYAGRKGLDQAVGQCFVQRKRLSLWDELDAKGWMTKAKDMPARPVADSERRVSSRGWPSGPDRCPR